MKLTSTAFSEAESIPVKHTCDGRDVSPPLSWEGVPAGARSLVLIADDPDAPRGPWVHWLLYDLSATARDLAEDIPKTQYLPGGAKQGLNDFKRLGYGGPCPPPGKPHRYYFRLYALDCPLELKAGATRKDLETAMQKHILDRAELMAFYGR